MNSNPRKMLGIILVLSLYLGLGSFLFFRHILENSSQIHHVKWGFSTEPLSFPFVLSVSAFLSLCATIFYFYGTQFLLLKMKFFSIGKRLFFIVSGVSILSLFFFFNAEKILTVPGVDLNRFFNVKEASRFAFIAELGIGIVPYLVGFALFLTFIVFVFSSALITQTKTALKFFTSADWKIILGYVLLFNAFILVYHRVHQKIFIWDQFEYWLRTYHRHLKLFDLKDLYGMILFSDYGGIHTLLPAVIMKLFRPDRDWYVLAIANLYYIPTAVLFVSLLKRLTGDRIACHVPAGFFGLGLLPLTLMINGHSSIGGLFFVLLAWSAYFFHTGSSSNITISTGFFIGFCFLLAFLFKRWFVFPIIATFVVWLCHGFWLVVHSRKIQTQVVLTFVSLFCLGISLAVLVFPRIVLIHVTDYASLYSPWKRDFSETFEAFFWIFGWVPFILFLSGILLAFKAGLKVTSSFFLGVLVIASLVFFSIQSPEIHHYVIFLPGLSFFVAIAVGFVLSRIREKIPRILWASSFLIVLTLGTLQTVISMEGLNFRPLMQGLSVHHRTTAGLDELKTVGGLIRPGAKVYFVSGRMSRIVFQHLDLYLRYYLYRDEENRFDFEVYGRDDDLRDGLPKEITEMRYVIVSTPLSGPASGFDSIRTDLAFFLDRQENVGKAFRLIKTIGIEGSQDNILLYERFRENTPTEIRDFHDHFRRIFPDHPNLFPEYSL